MKKECYSWISAAINVHIPYTSLALITFFVKQEVHYVTPVKIVEKKLGEQ